MGCGASRVTCPKCNKFSTNDGKIFMQHLTKVHTLKCNECGQDGFLSNNELETHPLLMHSAENNNKETVQHISCPKCGECNFDDGQTFLDHLRIKHSFSSNVNIRPQSASVKILTAATTRNSGHTTNVNQSKNLPKVGDKILAMWSQSAWQYFHATIIQFVASTLRYEIDWDDGDTTGRVVDYYNIAVDKIPEENQIGVGSVILFPQGEYTAGATQLTGGKRWHQGQITNIYKENGSTYYDGIHTKGSTDGKFVTYKGYTYNFKRFKLNEFRVGPNVFDILGDAIDEPRTIENIDIYFSYTEVDSPTLIETHQISYTPDSEQVNTSNLCDPVDIVRDLKRKGLNVVDGNNGIGQKDLKEKVNMMKNSKVFIACISDQYVLNEHCRMEFQYAKATLKKPVVPLVIGYGMEWKMSVVGMLIAGELYIHFKDTTVKEEKLQETLRCLRRHISDNNDGNIQQEQDNVIGAGDIFISYCWSNSYIAQENKQIPKLSAAQYSDPRLINKNISASGYNTWLDIERLKSADENAGIYEQIARALKESKLVVSCISDEYAESENCRMEFQFAVKSLQKKVIPVVVGTGQKWKQTVVGALLLSNEIEPINLQNIPNSQTFQVKLESLKQKIKGILNKESQSNSNNVSEPRKSRAPKVGDHVVSHHLKYSYYMATVVSYNPGTMEYTVDWDDGDPSGRVQQYNQVAIDVVPDPDDVGVGSIIFFPQGGYSATEGNNTGGVRYHEGIVTNANRYGDKISFDGHHTKGSDDGKWTTYRAYAYTFTDISLTDIRIAPTALETMLQ